MIRLTSFASIALFNTSAPEWPKRSIANDSQHDTFVESYQWHKYQIFVMAVAWLGLGKKLKTKQKYLVGLVMKTFSVKFK